MHAYPCATYYDVVAVHVSKTPGCTKSVNYYTFVNKGSQSHAGYIVDVPGYGYAKVSKSEQKKWHETVDGYLLSRDFTVLRYSSGVK